MQKTLINKEQERMKMNVMSIYIQDGALGTSLEPLEKITFFFPSKAKCITFLTHLKSQIKMKVQTLLFTTRTFLSRKEKAPLFKCIYKFMYYKWVFSPFQDDSCCFLTPHQFKDTLLSECHLAKNIPLGQSGTRDAQEKWKTDLSTASKSFKVAAKIESLCAIRVD